MRRYSQNSFTKTPKTRSHYLFYSRKRYGGITGLTAKMIYLIGTKKKINFGDHVFNQTMKHAKTYAVKLPIGFPCLITGMILRQYPNILYADEAPTKKPQVLSFDYKLFVGTHVPDIVFPKGKEAAEGFTC
ncbi:hypothetical protein QL285_082270 [Trifolium repens]|nr:hypothetical protein QL285_082270 [Trifolium repens]